MILVTTVRESEGERTREVGGGSAVTKRDSRMEWPHFPQQSKLVRDNTHRKCTVAGYKRISSTRRTELSARVLGELPPNRVILQR